LNSAAQNESVMQKVNILFVLTRLELGGAQQQLLELIRRLDKNRFRPFLLTGQDGLLVSEAASIEGLSLKRSCWLKRQICFFEDIIAFFEIYLFIKKHRIAIVHTHSSKAGILGRYAARLAGVKAIVHTIHGWSFNDYQPSWLKKLFISLEKRAARYSNRLIVVSLYDKQKGLASGIGQENQYSLIRYGVDRSRFGSCSPDMRQRLGLPSSGLVVGMIACFKPQKAIEEFIKAAYNISKAFPKVNFVLVGDGALRKKIEALIAGFNLQSKIVLTGWRRDVPELLSVFDVLVLTSLWEGLPIAVLEALASAKPVVVTQTGGVSEVVRDGENGFLAPQRDTAMLCEKLGILLNDSALRLKMSRAAAETLGDDFCVTRMLEKTQKLYEELICN
jgi:glycosyltransferase involved in cell wall biosynthesis